MHERVPLLSKSIHVTSLVYFIFLGTENMLVCVCVCRARDDYHGGAHSMYTRSTSLFQCRAIATYFMFFSSSSSCCARVYSDSVLLNAHCLEQHRLR